jgi:hypothetical protein
VHHWFHLWRPIFCFSDTISYFIDCIVVAGTKIDLSQRGFGGNGMSCILFQNCRQLAASALCKGMFDETIILQRSLENSDALPNVDELLCGFSKSNHCLLSMTNSLFTQLLCLVVLQCCTVKRFSAVTLTSHNLQNKTTFVSSKMFFTKLFNETINFTLSEHFTLGILKIETSEVLIRRDRMIIARAQIFSTTSQNKDIELRLTASEGERRTLFYFFFFMHNAFDYSKWLMPYHCCF